ncbi:MAG: hypothetical protein FJX37_08585, partial [Alphaproteobacteria bacterium]|nr:hypothetical protein [Alphaproteobacteria bacterium]
MCDHLSPNFVRFRYRPELSDAEFFTLNIAIIQAQVQLLTEYKKYLIILVDQTVAKGLLHVLKAAIRLPVGAFKPRLAFSGPANGVMTKFDTLMTAVVFAERGEVATAQSILSSLGSRLTAGGPRSLGR